MAAAGMQVAVLDRARFPRVKLCAGWLSEPVWDALSIAPREYKGGLWRWDKCHVDYGGRRYVSRVGGYFIRRYEFDAFLLRRAGAYVHEHAVKSIVRDGDRWRIDDAFEAEFLIGAGGTHCPVARALFPPKQRKPVGVQEREFSTDAAAIARTRAGSDGEPLLLLHGDLRGYSWNVPKTDWLNVGCGTMDPRDVREAWSHARASFEGAGTLPDSAAGELDKVKGHSYYLFDPAHLEHAAVDGAVLVGDALGLAQPLTAEGILPAVLSGRHAADAIVAGELASYPARLRRDPVLGDYELLFRARERGAALRSGGKPGRWPSVKPPAALERLAHGAIAGGFARMFAGRPLPARRLLHRIWRS